jgi:hypothetical protein
MHHHILVKIKGDYQDSALSEAKSELESSVDAEHNTVGWDFVSDDIEIIDEAWLKKEGFKSFKALEKRHLSFADDSIKEHKDALYDLLFLELAKRHVSGKDALTYVNYTNRFGNVDEDIKKIVESACKTKTTAKPFPTGLEDIAKELVDILDPKEHDMIGYHIHALEKIYDCKKYPEPYNTLQCTDYNFADLKGEGEHTYYFIFDRHF